MFQEIEKKKREKEEAKKKQMEEKVLLNIWIILFINYKRAATKQNSKYHLKNTDLWDNDGTFGRWFEERSTINVNFHISYY